MVPLGGPKTTPGILSWLKGALALAVSGAGTKSTTQSAKGPGSPCVQPGRQSAGAVSELVVEAVELLELEEELLSELVELSEPFKVSELLELPVLSEFFVPEGRFALVEFSALLSLSEPVLGEFVTPDVLEAASKSPGPGSTTVGSWAAAEPELLPQAVRLATAQAHSGAQAAVARKLIARCVYGPARPVPGLRVPCNQIRPALEPGWVG